MLERHPLASLSLIAIALIIGLSLLDLIAQNETYHQFSDVRTVFDVPNFWNVVSNFPFLFVGVYALTQLIKQKSMLYDTRIKHVYFLFFLAISLVAFGSIYYHLEPNNYTLIWDRLPMVIAFMSLLAIVIAEFLSINSAKKLLYPLLFIGIFSVLYWAYTESIGEGDLRIYVFVQVFPMIVIPLLLMKFKSVYTLQQGYWYLLGAYMLAKLFEYYDESIYNILGFISGHSLKHIVAAFGLYILIRVFIKREKTKDSL